MKQIKLLLSAFAILACSSAAYAEDGLKLKVNPAEGTPASVDITAGDILTFSDAGMKVMNGDVQKAAFDWTQINTLTFDGASGIETMTADSGMRPLQNPVNDIFATTCPPEQPCPLYISDMNGALVLRINAWNGEPVDVSALSSGFYLVKINNLTFKIIKR